VSQERINQFAQATGDFQWIHVNVGRFVLSKLEDIEDGIQMTWTIQG
jgi:hypothetical protein